MKRIGNLILHARWIRRRLAKAEPRLYLVNEFFENRDCVNEVLGFVCAELKKSAIHAVPVKLSKLASYPYSAGDVVVAHQPILKTRLSNKVKCLGMPSLSRRQRLDFLERNDFPVMPWAKPKNRAELAALFERWSAEFILLKRDGSLKARGVSLVYPKDVPSLSWNDDDVFCPVLKEDPTTYKAHFLGNQVLCTYAMATPPIYERRLFNLRGPSLESEFIPFEIDSTLAAEIGRIGWAILGVGGGYSSMDLMKCQGRLVAIELNTNSIGTTFPWALFSERVKTGMVAALAEIYQRRSEFETDAEDTAKAVQYFAKKADRHSFRSRLTNTFEDMRRTARMAFGKEPI